MAPALGLSVCPPVCLLSVFSPSSHLISLLEKPGKFTHQQELFLSLKAKQYGTEKNNSNSLPSLYCFNIGLVSVQDCFIKERPATGKEL